MHYIVLYCHDLILENWGQIEKTEKNAFKLGQTASNDFKLFFPGIMNSFVPVFSKIHGHPCLLD